MKKEKSQEGFFKNILNEIRNSILFELIWSILLFIPRMIIRLIRNISYLIVMFLLSNGVNRFCEQLCQPTVHGVYKSVRV